MQICVIEAVNGVKQGAILSLIRFSIYMDELLLKLQKSGFGCHIANVVIAPLAYVDITLIILNLKSLKMIVKICEDYESDHYVAFNGNKSKLMFF